VNLVVDTSVWSLLLRREHHDENNSYLIRLRKSLQSEDTVYLIGQILQELLDGLRSQDQFELLISFFEPFPLIELVREDFIHAARLKNYCRGKGVQAGSVDFLIAAACERRNVPLLTSDRDFERISKHSDLLLLKPA
jgi:predicted nucleic acid-binding protein